MNMGLIIGAGLVIALLIAFLIYRNLKDESDYEETMDETHEQHKHKGDKT